MTAAALGFWSSKTPAYVHGLASRVGKHNLKRETGLQIDAHVNDVLDVRPVEAPRGPALGRGPVCLFSAAAWIATVSNESFCFPIVMQGAFDRVATY